jgi:hypothetical protein
VANLGRKDELIASGRLDDIIRSITAFSQELRVSERSAGPVPDGRAARSWGPALVFRRLWEEQGLPEILRKLAAGRRFRFDVDRVAFALALQRLCAPGSDRQGAAWLRTVECPGFEDIELQHLYRTVAFLAEVRDDLEAELFRRDHDGATEVNVMFMDTTSTYIYRSEPTELRKRGYSRDRMPDYVQVVLCVAVDADGFPVAWEILPGNTADKNALVSLLEKMRGRFKVRHCVVVGDRGMIGAETIALLEGHDEAPFDYILGCRMRAQNEVREEVLGRAGRYHHVEENLDVKEVLVEGARYVVCRNPIEARKDAEDRAAIVAKLEEALGQGPKGLIGNKGYARFLRGAKGAWTIDEDAVAADARLDGKFVLRTNTTLETADVARAYKGLWRVERAFREEKSTLEIRPVYHHTDEGTIGHIAACFLALRLEVDLQQRLDNLATDVPWPDLMLDLAEVRAMDVAVDGRLYRTRPPLVRHAHLAFAAAGVRPPPVHTLLGIAPPRPPDAGDPVL